MGPEAFVGITGLSVTAVGGWVWRRTAAKRASMSRAPLKIEVARDDTEPGAIWEVATDEVLERDNFLDVYSLDENGVIQPNRFLRKMRRRWAVYDVGETSLNLEIFNPSEVPVWITGMEAIGEERRSAPKGTNISNPPQGEFPVLELRIDLGGTRGRAKDANGADYFAQAKREIASGGREFIGLTAHCAEDAVRWRLRFDLLIGGQRATQLFPAENHSPLLTSGYLPVDEYERSWVCSPVVMACDDALEPPHLHDTRLDSI